MYIYSIYVYILYSIYTYTLYMYIVYTILYTIQYIYSLYIYILYSTYIYTICTSILRFFCKYWSDDGLLRPKLVANNRIIIK